MKLVPACLKDLPLLPTIALKSKSHWDYPQNFLDKCKVFFEEEFTEEYLKESHTFIIKQDEEIIGMGSLLWKEVPMIDNFWLLPENIGKGYGKQAFDLLVQEAKNLGWPNLTAIADIYAEGFYKAMGAKRVGEVPSEVQDKMLPKMFIDLI
ncbi:GNAT family N-acetyltransferase [Kiloniella majae]|uniref:GNAT family N-acetyltransferase n=1 Tax=Kiloniella majae TaxID=1938558 RepID=UPI000A277096|nr:GNAT family N-acetyltransferase [Kiloniella majae]